MASGFSRTCDNRDLRILHVIHDFLPRHRAGSEIYAFELARALSTAHDVTVFAAEYDPERQHGQMAWRLYQGVRVVEVVNNWMCRSFEDTYRPPLIADRFGHALQAIQPDVVHIHSLLNLSFDLPAIARAHGMPSVATLHDYSLVCPSGGQRVHRDEQHVCHEIDAARCVRCFRQSPIHAQISFGALAAAVRAPGRVRRLAVHTARRFPVLTGRVVRASASVSLLRMTEQQIEARLAAARRVYDDIDLFVAPSQSVATEYLRLGIDPLKLQVSDYGFVPFERAPARRPHMPLRIGYVGTLVWHKGLHVLIDAVKNLAAGTNELKIFGALETFPEYVAALRQQAAGLPVEFLGGFDPADASGVYSQIDVLVVPSLWLENSPLVIHEAFMAGVPVIGANIGGIADLIDHGRTGLLYDPTSPAALTEALRRVIDEPDRLEQFARQLPLVKTMADDAREWEKAYRSVLRQTAAAEGA